MPKRKKAVHHRTTVSVKKASSFNKWFLTPKMIVLMLLIGVLGVIIVAVQNEQQLLSEAKEVNVCGVKGNSCCAGPYSCGTSSYLTCKSNICVVSTPVVVTPTVKPGQKQTKNVVPTKKPTPTPTKKVVPTKK